MYIKAGDEIQLQRIDGVWKQIGCVGEENRLLAHWTEMERPLKTRSKAEAYGAYSPASIRSGKRWTGGWKK